MVCEAYYDLFFWTRRCVLSAACFLKMLFSLPGARACDGRSKDECLKLV